MSVVDALVAVSAVNVCAAVKELEVYVLGIVVEAFIKRFAAESEYEVRQTPPTAKHPFAKLIPLAKVEVAAPLTLKLFTESPPANVEVELVPSTLKNPCSVEVPVNAF
jgi:hypothetical protein